MKRIISGALIAILVLIFVFGGPLFNLKFRMTPGISNFFDRLGGKADLRLRIKELENENQNLRAELFREEIGLTSSEKIKVYSSYPLNTRSEIAIAGGASRGIEIGDIVTSGENIIVGKVTKVFKSSAVLRTIFDPSWEIPIRIGKSEVDALLESGAELRATLIAREAPIETGEPVITAGADLPYGLMVGFIKEIKETPGSTFKEAIIEPSLRLQDLRDVNLYR
ncbi:MAG: rod shape-determining protein MreC [Candidatus Colwellbacteria bacterium]|nr:rod shape-determining protein MreC [Candidatus Colwellbacteria bacterium]